MILPFFLIAARSCEEADVLRTAKVATLFLSLAICLRYPGYLVLILLVYFFSRWYYRIRFDLNYPNLRT